VSTTSARTARKPFYCSKCQWRATEDDTPVIAPGHRYLRHVGFPGEDGVSGERPWVLRECVACAVETDDAAHLDAGACGSYCHGTTPCALPFQKGAPGHECQCRECARLEVAS
jgi:hypothetical protein